jgi:DNA-damage-inducible protein D
VADENTNLSETALQSGVQRENLGLFHDAGYHGMYTMSSSSLAAFWNLPPSEEILDVMGSEALAANLFRITATESKLKEDHVTDKDTALEIHHDVGVIVRKAVEEIHKKKPEDLPRAANIRRLVEEDRRRGRKARQIIEQAEESGQGTLF